MQRFLRMLGATILLAAVVIPARQASAYVEIVYPLGRVIQESSNIVIIKVDKVDKEKNTIIYRKVADLKGTHPGETIKHMIAHNGFNPREWQIVMQWAEPGQIAIMFHNGGAAEVCINNYWYQVMAGEWWNMSHAEPYFLRSYAGRPEKLAQLLPDILKGAEVTVPAMVDGDKMALQTRTARLQRIKASLKLVDYNAKRDFAGWGVEEFRAVLDMPGFSQYSGLSRTDPGAAGVAIADIDGDGKPDVMLYGDAKVALLQNGGGALNEIPLPYTGGAHGASIADYNGDSKPDILLATPSGPKLLTNKGGAFKDDSAGLPKEPYYNLTTCAWIDYDGNGRPDVLLADAYRGLRLYRNKSADTKSEVSITMGKWQFLGPFDNQNSQGMNTAYPPEKELDLSKEYDVKDGHKAAWTEAEFSDTSLNDLRIFSPFANDNAVVYLYREVQAKQAMDLPVWMHTDDAAAIWVNGKKLDIAPSNNDKGAKPLVKLALVAGKNTVLMKIAHKDGPCGFFFAPTTPVGVITPLFEDVTDKVGLGTNGAAGNIRGDQLIIADVNSDGRPDILFCGGQGVLLINTPNGFVESKDSGLKFETGRIRPVFGDFFGDGKQHLFVPQRGICKLYRNDGKGHFADVTAHAGALAQPIGEATSGASSDFSKTGKLDLFVGCVKGPNRYFKNMGNGVFTDGGDEIGLYQHVYNTRALAAVDLNKDGVPDLILNNEGQESSCLIGNPSRLNQQSASVGAKPESHEAAAIADDSRRNDESSAHTKVASFGFFNWRSLGVLCLVVVGFFAIRRRRLANESWQP